MRDTNRVSNAVDWSRSRSSAQPASVDLRGRPGKRLETGFRRQGVGDRPCAWPRPSSLDAPRGQLAGGIANHSAPQYVQAPSPGPSVGDSRGVAPDDCHRDDAPGPAVCLQDPEAEPRVHVLRGAHDCARAWRQRRDLQPRRRRAAQVDRIPGARADRPAVGKTAARPAQRHRCGQLPRLDPAEPVVRSHGGADGRDDELHAGVGDGRQASRAADRSACAGYVVSAPYFDVFGTQAAIGRTFARDEDQRGKEKVDGHQPSALGEPVRWRPDAGRPEHPAERRALHR